MSELDHRVHSFNREEQVSPNLAGTTIGARLAIQFVRAFP